MRILKIVLIVILVIIGLYLLISLFLPSSFNVARTININASQRAVFVQVHDYKNWEAWSPWLPKDTTMVLRYGPITAGEGATYSWTSDQDPNGNQQMIKVVEMDTILTKLNFEDQEPADGYWYFAKAGEGRTSVTWGLKGDLPFFGRIFGLFADGQIGNDFEAGLSNLKYLVESSKSEFIERPVQTVEKDSIIYLSISENVDMASLSEEGSMLYARNYSKILYFLGKRKDSIVVGNPFAIYHEWDEETRQARIEFCIPIDTTSIETEGEINRRILSRSSGLEVDYFGPYSLVGQAHVQIEEHAENQSLDLAPFGIEFFVTDPGAEPDTSKWLTKVYYPVL